MCEIIITTLIAITVIHGRPWSPESWAITSKANLATISLSLLYEVKREGIKLDYPAPVHLQCQHHENLDSPANTPDIAMLLLTKQRKSAAFLFYRDIGGHEQDIGSDSSKTQGAVRPPDTPNVPGPLCLLPPAAVVAPIIDVPVRGGADVEA